VPLSKCLCQFAPINMCLRQVDSLTRGAEQWPSKRAYNQTLTVNACLSQNASFNYPLSNMCLRQVDSLEEQSSGLQNDLSAERAARAAAEIRLETAYASR